MSSGYQPPERLPVFSETGNCSLAVEVDPARILAYINTIMLTLRGLSNLFNLIFQSLEVVSCYRDTQLKVTEHLYDL